MSGTNLSKTLCYPEILFSRFTAGEGAHKTVHLRAYLPTGEVKAAFPLDNPSKHPYQGFVIVNPVVGQEEHRSCLSVRETLSLFHAGLRRICSVPAQ